MTTANHAVLKDLLAAQRILADRLNGAVRSCFPIGCIIEYPQPGKVRVEIRATVKKHKCQGSRCNMTLLVNPSYDFSGTILLTKTVSDLNLAEIKIISLP